MPGDVVPHSRPPRSEPRPAADRHTDAWPHFIAGDDVPAIDIVPRPFCLVLRRMSGPATVSTPSPLQIRRSAAARRGPPATAASTRKLGARPRRSWTVCRAAWLRSPTVMGDPRVVGGERARRRAAHCKLEPDFGWSESAGGYQRLGPPWCSGSRS